MSKTNLLKRCIHAIKKDCQKYEKKIAPVVTIVALYAVLQAFEITCPIKYLTGISCAGCGTTRAWFSFLRGDIKTAFYYHPLFLMPMFVILLYFKRNSIDKRFSHGILVLLILSYAILYIYRMKTGCSGTIVVFEPQNGLIGRGIQAVVKFLQMEV